MSCSEGAISSAQSWVREYLAPALQLNMWKTRRQLPVSACFNWFIFCSSEQKCWGHGSLAQHDAQVSGLVSVPIPEPVGLILLQLGTRHSRNLVLLRVWPTSLAARPCRASCAACELFLSCFRAILGCPFGCAGLLKGLVQALCCALLPWVDVA